MDTLTAVEEWRELGATAPVTDSSVGINVGRRHRGRDKFLGKSVVSVRHSLYPVFLLSPDCRDGPVSRDTPSLMQLTQRGVGPPYPWPTPLTTFPTRLQSRVNR